MTNSVPGSFKARTAAALRALLKALAIACSWRALPLWIAFSWFSAAFAVELWVGGLVPFCFMTPDEAVNRLGGLQVSLHASPALPLPFPDPEDLLHPRHWISLEGRAIPGYAPVSIYVYGLLTRLGKLGFVIITALPASGAAAFALGTARLLPLRRAWLSVFAPALGFPALYWLLRPWMNISALLVALCWGFFFWAQWHASQRPLWLQLAVACVGAGAAVRPDYAAYLFSILLLLCVAARPSEWKRIALLVLATGVVAVALNLLLNKLTTGNAFEAAYQILSSREEHGATVEAGFGARLVRLLGQLVMPFGLRPSEEIRHFLGRYWLELWPLQWLLLAQLALIPLLVMVRGKRRWFYTAALLLVPLFLVSRIHPDLFGSELKISSSHHSIPRYWTPAYLFAALPPILLLGRVRWWFVWVPGTLALAALMLLELDEMYSRQPSSNLKAVRQNTAVMERTLAHLRTEIPSDAVVYSDTFDKVLWSGWRVATISENDPALTAASIERALGAGLVVYAADDRSARLQRRLASALRRRHLELVPMERSRVDVFRIERRK